MTDYTIKDVNFLKKDTDKSPNSFTPLFEVPGELYSQSYPKRLKHTFPENGVWSEQIEFQGEKLERWKKKVFERYVE